MPLAADLTKLAPRYDTGSPQVKGRDVLFALHDHAARQVEVFGSWDQWRQGVPARPVEPGLWRTTALALAPGRHGYKFKVEGNRWLHDPANPQKSPDGHGGLNAVVTIEEQADSR